MVSKRDKWITSTRNTSALMISQDINAVANNLKDPLISSYSEERASDISITQRNSSKLLCEGVDTNVFDIVFNNDSH